MLPTRGPPQKIPGLRPKVTVPLQCRARRPGKARDDGLAGRVAAVFVQSCTVSAFGIKLRVP